MEQGTVSSREDATNVGIPTKRKSAKLKKRKLNSAPIALVLTRQWTAAAPNASSSSGQGSRYQNRSRKYERHTNGPRRYRCSPRRTSLRCLVRFQPIDRRINRSRQHGRQTNRVRRYRHALRRISHRCLVLFRPIDRTIKVLNLQLRQEAAKEILALVT